MPCSYCDEGRRRGARFCSECGSRLTQDEPGSPSGDAGHGLAGELRQLTVAFCDLAGSTELSSRLDAEAFGELLGLYHASIAGVVGRYGGRVLKYLGDGALIAFGWPVANDDDAERAVRAALDLVSAVAALADLDRNLPMSARIGIHSGEAFVGEVVGEGYREETVFGETVNLASRLQQVAEPGSVLISDATLALVRGIFITEDQGVMDLRGVTRQVRAHRVRQRGGTRSRFAAGRRSLTPFVGRGAERDALLRVCELVEGRPRAALVSGEPGVGKSRLVYEVKEALAGTAHTWLEGQCSSYTSNTALRPVTDVLEEALAWARVLPDERPAHLRAALDRVDLLSERSFSVVSDLLSLRADRPAVPMEADERRRATYELLTAWLTALTRHQPLIMVVEDLQWADASTLELLTFLVENASGVPLALIGTARPEFNAAAFLGGAAEIINLAPLSDDGMRDLIAGLGAAAVTGAVDNIVELSSGIPLYAEEIVASLSSSAAAWSDPAARSEQIPPTLHELLGARLDRTGSAKRIAQVCAVVGDEFDEDLIAQISGDDPAVVTRALSRLAFERLVVPAVASDGTAYTFCNSLLRDAAYQSLLRRARRELHAAAAAALHARLDRGAAGVAPERVARQYRDAGLRREAVEMYRAAARRCAEQAAHRERSAHLSAAFDLLDDHDPALRCDVLLELGDALWRDGDYEPARARFKEAAEAAQHAGDASCLAQAALGYAGRMGYGAGAANATLIDLLELALARLPADQSGPRAVVTGRLAQALTFAEDRERRFGLAEQALQLAESSGDPAVRAAVHTDVHWAVWGPDTIDQRLGLARDAITLALEAGDQRLEAEGRMWLVSDLLEASDVAQARAELELWARLAERVQDNYQLWAVATATTMFNLLDGHLDEGERLATEALSLAREGYNENAFQLFGVQISHVRREQGRWPELEEPLKVLVANYPAIPTWRAALAALYAEAGRVHEAREQLGILADGEFAGFGKDLFFLANMTLAADTCTIVGDRACAELLYRKLAPYPRRAVMAAPFGACWGSTSRSLAILARTMGDLAASEAHFEEALAHSEQLQAAAPLARALVEYAQLLISRDEPGDRARATALATRAMQLSEKLSFPLRTEQARQLLDRLDGRIAAPLSSLDEMT